jgi:putative acetyltransferase
MIIRPIQQKDNLQIAAVIRNVLIEFNVPKVGTAFSDPQLDCLFETYRKPDAIYFVIENGSKIIGGAGIMQLENESQKICELQKMYFLPESRSLGLGIETIELCLKKAVEFGFEKCYLETMPNMFAAQKLYQKVGFEFLQNPMGNTGHTNCPVWMIKNLTE